MLHLHTQVIENCAIVYPTVQLRTPFRQEKAIKNDVMTTVYHLWYHDVVITSYPLLVITMLVTAITILL